MGEPPVCGSPAATRRDQPGELADLQVTPNGHVLIWPVAEGDDVGHAQPLGVEADLRANLRRLAMAAGLDAAEWSAFAERVRSRVGWSLEHAD
ncbi:hypothetical protein [uncultured Thiocystis sp.]|uniref:hypothetical protein n=1 Tax=uncultured Thiocystis sp. TaxID=1202134 RepID=UPI0025CBE7F9|nr:hypothetical protein [uncultured Thiocystis sp.]